MNIFNCRRHLIFESRIRISSVNPKFHTHLHILPTQMTFISKWKEFVRPHVCVCMVRSFYLGPWLRNSSDFHGLVSFHPWIGFHGLVKKLLFIAFQRIQGRFQAIPGWKAMRPWKNTAHEKMLLRGKMVTALGSTVTRNQIYGYNQKIANHG